MLSAFPFLAEADPAEAVLKLLFSSLLELQDGEPEK